MKKILLAGLMALPLSLQAATLSMGDNIELMAVNGKKVESTFWSPNKSVELASGKHQVVVRFDGELKNGSKTKMHTTRPYLFELEVPEQESTIVLPRLNNLSQAKAHFDRGPQWQLELADGTTRTLDYVPLHGKGFVAHKDIEGLVADYNRKHGITFELGYAVDLKKAAVEVTEQGEVKITGDALAQLKLWYSKANAKEKAAFQQWVKAQDAL
ncbi:DUF2057 domain-containing protein [uncultured Photobacterium sp.]|uniref:YccT family protein n=1 Tax=uncultured Photobacterium sp. TaxID=173973 RepID=UPI0026062EDE|nr:DUF2057 domain-containing protein [uncultured Photobacterium sp.]